jgi:hypothetical protein
LSVGVGEYMESTDIVGRADGLVEFSEGTCGICGRGFVGTLWGKDKNTLRDRTATSTAVIGIE